MGCEAKNEFLIYASEEAARNKEPEMFYSLEESSCCLRCCCKNNRPFKQTIWAGTKDGHSKENIFMEMEKPFACPLQPCKGPCCLGLCINSPPFIQNMNMGDVGTVDIPCFFCIPNMKVKTPDGNVQYQLQQPSCMGGMCVNCMAEGCCNCKIPFYIYEPGEKCEDGKQVGKIVKQWRGVGTELFTDAATFSVEFPSGCDEATKKRILGSVFMVNIEFFEKGNQ
jgi:hypothetical protein